MTHRLMSYTAALTVAFGLALLAPALRAQREHARTGTHQVSLTGCLSRGDEPHEVWLVTKSGKVYGLEAPRTKLESHIGERARVTGSMVKEGREEAGEEAREERKTGRHETGDFRVESVKFLGGKCKA